MRATRNSHVDQCIRLVEDAQQPTDARRQALAQIPPEHLPAVYWSRKDDDLGLLLDGFDFSTVSQRWCLDTAVWCRSPSAARRAFEYVVDPRIIRSGLEPGRPAWMIEDCARRLGVSPPLTQNLLPLGMPSPLMRVPWSPWIPLLLSASTSDRRQSPCRYFEGFAENASSLARLPRRQRNFFRLLESEPASTREHYLVSPPGYDRWYQDPGEVAIEGTDPLLERLNAPRHFRVQPGWAIGYGSSFYHSHHGKIRGTLVSEVFTHRIEAEFTSNSIVEASTGLHDVWFIEEEDRPPAYSVPVCFDLEGIHLPNTEEALLELASILRLPTYTSVNPQARPQQTVTEERTPRVVLGDAWSGVTFFEEGRHQGEGQGNWGCVQSAIFHVEIIVIWKPFPLLGVHSAMIDNKETRPPD
jgi:hypothetical protein